MWDLNDFKWKRCELQSYRYLRDIQLWYKVCLYSTLFEKVINFTIEPPTSKNLFLEMALDPSASKHRGIFRDGCESYPSLKIVSRGGLARKPIWKSYFDRAASIKECLRCLKIICIVVLRGTIYIVHHVMGADKAFEVFNTECPSKSLCQTGVYLTCRSRNFLHMSKSQVGEFFDPQYCSTTSGIAYSCRH